MNRLLKQFLEMQKMMKKLKGGGLRKMLRMPGRAMPPGMMPPGGGRPG